MSSKLKTLKDFVTRSEIERINNPKIKREKNELYEN